MRAITALTALAALGMACGDNQEASAPPPPTAEDPAAAAPEEPEPDNTLRHLGAFAVFEDDALAACMEYEAVLEAPEPLPDPWPPEAWSTMTQTPELPDNAVAVDKACAEQFPDRDVMARCSVPIDGAADIEFRSLYYGSQVFDSDTEMRECMRRGGEWSRVDPDSSEALDVRANAARRDAERRLRRLQGR